MTDPEEETEAVLNRWSKELRDEEQGIEDAINKAAKRIAEENEKENG